MQHTYGDLGDYIHARRRSDTADTRVRQQYTAWNRFNQDLPDLAGTNISAEHTDKAITQFEENATDLQPVTIGNYKRSFQESVDDFLHYIDETGNTQLDLDAHSHAPTQDQGQTRSGVLTYSDAHLYFLAYREENPDDLDGKHWTGAFKAVGSRVQIDDTTISPEHTEDILEAFNAVTAAEKRNRLKSSTVSSYRTWFRQAIRAYCKYIDMPYPELNVQDRRRRTLAQHQNHTEAATIQASEPVETKKDHTEAPVAAETPSQTVRTVPQAEYKFLLRPGVRLAINLPDDLTHTEADRLSQWVSSFVIDGSQP